MLEGRRVGEIWWLADLDGSLLGCVSVWPCRIAAGSHTGTCTKVVDPQLLSLEDAKAPLIYQLRRDSATVLIPPAHRR